MPKSQIGPAALGSAMLAGALALMLLPGPFTWLTSVGGVTLLLILLAYDQEGHRSFFQSLAFSAVVGFCVVLASVIVFQLSMGITAADKRFSEEWMPLIWAAATAIFCGIDRTRMGARELSAAGPIGSAVPTLRTFVPEYTPAPAPAPDLQPTPVERPPQPAPPETAKAQPVPIPAKPGKETMIYVSLVGEGLNVLRSVKAEHLGRDFYKIIDSMPEGETWEYQPGQIVRCKKKNLSSGKGLVAVEEAPRA